MVVAAASLFAFVLLFVLDSMAGSSNPYVGILTYIVAPGFLILGLGLMLVGVLRQRRRLGQALGGFPAFQIDFSRPRDRRVFTVFLAGALVFLLLTAFGSYHTYHFTESVTFCGQTCHTVMQPELTTYLHGPHARVSCTECHIGPGATWFVRSKLSGTYQVYATLANKYPRPVPTPIKNLRPAQDTCEQCHWPSQHTGNIDKTYHYFLGDEANSKHTLRLLLKVGGTNPKLGPVGGIHWHMNVGRKIEYLAVDEARQEIPWVRLTDANGQQTVWHTPEFTNDIAGYTLRTMDCMDCHNRPAHRFRSPNEAVNLALELDRIDPALPYIKTNAVYVLVQEYADEAEARRAIEAFLRSKYPNEPRVWAAIQEVQRIYSDNFFPHMQANWRAYPDNVGHKDWPGCVRCHDDNHFTADGKSTIVFNDCNTCHVILAQGSGEELQQLSSEGHPFKHPGEEEYDPAFQCTDCHTGGL